ncbi:cytochrome c [Polaromonas sp.]|uniref:SorU family sulfite dehydrogenase c-type cytochrome subunit n=1 Tax=Polaromonas sp. TaxID=1869339 RepID=UPI00286B1A65|nr:cytochrome c [Polaromonas sp.]
MPKFSSFSASRFSLAALAGLAAFTASPASAQDDAAQLALGKKLFMQAAVPACAVCHTLKDAGASGAIGPVLDELKPDAQRVAKALRNGIGQMPSYKASLSEDQILALSQYVATASGAAR